MKPLIIGLCLISASLVNAASDISVTVSTIEPSASGIGYLVNGKKIGGPGKTYTGKGPLNGTYSFGYRKKSAQGKNISCGSHTLKKNSQIILQTKKNKCTSIVKN